MVLYGFGYREENSKCWSWLCRKMIPEWMPPELALIEPELKKKDIKKEQKKMLSAQLDPC